MKRTSSPDGLQPGQLGYLAPYYDLLMKFLTAGREGALRRACLDLSAIKAGDTVLEVGCGTGTLSLAASRRVGTAGAVYGVDIAPEMIKVARRKNARAGDLVDFQVATIDRLPFPDATVDVTLCSFMIFHMPDDVRRRGLREIHRVLKPAGTLLVIEAGKPDLDGLRRDMVAAGLSVSDHGKRRVASLAPTIHFVRATAAGR